MRYTLSEPGIRYVTRRDRAQLTTTMAAWSTEETTDNQGRPPAPGTPHPHLAASDQARRRASPGSCPSWPPRPESRRRRANCSGHVPAARADRAFNRGDDAIAPDAVGHLLTGGLHVPFYFEHELRARHPRGVAVRLRPYFRYYRSDAPRDDQPPFPTTVFVVEPRRWPRPTPAQRPG